MTIRVLYKEIRHWKEKASQNPCFFNRYFPDNSKIGFFCAPKNLQKHGADAEGHNETHTRGIFLGDESRTKLSQRAEKFEKIN